MLQPFVKRAHLRQSGSDQLRPTSKLDAVSKLEEAVALVDTLGCEVVFKEVGVDNSRLQRQKKRPIFTGAPPFACVTQLLCVRAIVRRLVLEGRIPLRI